MTILFEDYFYDAITLGNILPEELLSWSADRKNAKSTFVGYHYCSKGNWNDAVFILPKVFVDPKGRPFGKEDITFVSFLDNSKSLPELLGEENAQIVSRLSFWIYSAISRYAERHPNTDILRNKSIQEIKSVGEYDTSTLIDVIQSLRKFNHDHQNLFTFIVNCNRSGIHNIHWNRTLNKVQPFMQDGEPLYLDFYNKKKNINFDEELIVLFFSVLEYLKEKYFFDVPINLNYNLIPPHEIENLLEAETGTILMNKIRHKYFPMNLSNFGICFMCSLRKQRELPINPIWMSSY